MILSKVKTNAFRSVAALIFAGLILANPDAVLAQDIEVKGPLESISENEIVVQGVPFAVTANTRIEGDKGVYMRFEDFREGHRVEVEGYRDRDTGMMASKIEWEADEVEAEGRVDSITDNSVTVNGIRFEVDRQTRMEDYLRLSEIREGDMLEVDAIRDGEGRFVAHKMERERSSSNEVKAEGQIEMIDGERLTVNGISFQIGSRTRLDDYQRMDDIRQGDVVEVEGFRNRDGDLVTSKIERDGSSDGPPRGRRGPRGSRGSK